MKTSELTQINGVVLTPEAANELKSLQEHNNEFLKANSETIADAITFLATCEDASEETQTLIRDLGYIRRSLKRIRKP